MSQTRSASARTTSLRTDFGTSDVYNPPAASVVRVCDNTTLAMAAFMRSTNASSYLRPIKIAIRALRFDDGSAWDLAGTQVKLGGTGNDTLTGASGNDVIFSDAGNDTINAGAGNDILSGGVGTDALNGGLGDDIYLFRRGEGQDILSDTGGQDRLLLGADIVPDQVWLSHTGSDLVIDLVGGSDRVTIKNWYIDPANQVETLASRDGWSLDHTQVDQLVAAMAAFAPPSGTATALPTDVAAAVAPVIAANWQHAA
ncbi:serralysin [uncultured Gammaproteobacteria bacterium]